MITLRSSKARSEVALICLEVTLTTPRSVYTIFSEGPMTDLGSSFDGALFGAISWPISCFRLAEGVLIEQQMFLPHDGSAVALSWTLQGNTGIAVQLVVRPFFCEPMVVCSIQNSKRRTRWPVLSFQKTRAYVCPPRGS